MTDRVTRYGLRSWPYHWRCGRRDGFPVCCIVRWIVGHSPGRRQGLERGRRHTPDGTAFVPCGLLHRGDA